MHGSFACFRPLREKKGCAQDDKPFYRLDDRRVRKLVPNRSTTRRLGFLRLPQLDAIAVRIDDPGEATVVIIFAVRTNCTPSFFAAPAERLNHQPSN